MKKNNPGIAFPIVLLLGVVLFILAITIAAVATQIKVTETVYQKQQVLLQMARGGAEEALHYLNCNLNWEEARNFIPKSEKEITLGEEKAYYQLAVLDSRLAQVKISSQAYFRDYLSRKTQKREIVLVAKRDISPFQYGLFGAKTINMTAGSLVDSFNSELGSYAVSNQTQFGDIGCNSLEEGAVSLNGASKIFGDIFISPEADSDLVVQVAFNSFCYGQITQMQMDFPLTGVDIPDGNSQGNLRVVNQTMQLYPDNYGNLTMVHGVLLLNPGNYVFNNISMKQYSEIRLKSVDSPTNIYLTGNLDAVDKVGRTIIMGGSVINPSEKPPLLYLYGGPNCRKISLVGRKGSGPACYFSLYAPATDVEVYNNAEIYGSVIADDITLYGYSDIHYDQALRYRNIVPLNTRIVSWEVY